MEHICLEQTAKLFEQLEEICHFEFPKGCVRLNLRNRFNLIIVRVNPIQPDEYGPRWVVQTVTRLGYRRRFIVGISNANDYEIQIDSTRKVQRRTARTFESVVYIH